VLLGYEYAYVVAVVAGRMQRGGVWLTREGGRGCYLREPLSSQSRSKQDLERASKQAFFLSVSRSRVDESRGGASVRNDIPINRRTRARASGAVTHAHTGGGEVASAWGGIDDDDDDDDRTQENERVSRLGAS